MVWPPSRAKYSLTASKMCWACEAWRGVSTMMRNARLSAGERSALSAFDQGFELDAVNGELGMVGDDRDADVALAFGGIPSPAGCRARRRP